MLKLDSNIDLRLFFKWWGHQLSLFLPKKLREALTQGKSLLVIETHIETATIYYVNREQETLLGEFSFDALAKEELQNLIENNPTYREADIVLRVPEQFSVKQDVFLPRAAEANLHQVMSYELDRYTPFNKEQVYFDFLKRESGKNKSLIHLILIVVKKTHLETLYKNCLQLGLKPMFADSARQVIISGVAKNNYNLLPPLLCQKPNRTPLFLMISSLLVTVLLFVVLLIIPLHKTASGLDKLKAHARKVESKALLIEDSKNSIDSLYQTTQKLVNKKKDSPSMINVINTLSRVLGDDTWISRLHYVNKTLQLSGQSAIASNLIVTLEETHLFHNVKFTSPVTKDKRSGLERFQISSQVQVITDANTD